MWGIYSLIPTFLDETAEEKLARQALEADSGPIVDDTERLPEAANLPPDLRFQVLSALPDCRTACKSYDSNPSGFEWVREYYTGDGQTARERCAQMPLWRMSGKLAVLRRSQPVRRLARLIRWRTLMLSVPKPV